MSAIQELKSWRAIVVALFALTQVFPAGQMVVAGVDGPSLVMCTGSGAQTVTWEEVTGEPSPFENPAELSDNGCHACPLGACAGGVVKPHSGHFHIAGLSQSVDAPRALRARAQIGAWPAAPSRAPPMFA